MAGYMVDWLVTFGGGSASSRRRLAPALRTGRAIDVRLRTKVACWVAAFVGLRCFPVVFHQILLLRRRLALARCVLTANKHKARTANRQIVRLDQSPL